MTIYIIFTKAHVVNQPIPVAVLYSDLDLQTWCARNNMENYIIHTYSRDYSGSIYLLETF